MKIAKENNGSSIRFFFEEGKTLLRLEEGNIRRLVDEETKLVVLDLTGVKYVSDAFLDDCVELENFLFRADLSLAVVGLDRKYVKELSRRGGKYIHCFETLEAVEHYSLPGSSGSSGIEVGVTAREKRMLWGKF